MEYKMMIRAAYPNLKIRKALADKTYFSLADKNYSSH